MFDSFETITSSKIQGVSIHPTAQVAKSAELGANVFIGAGAIVGPQVKLHDGVKVAPYASITGRTTVGAQTEISSFATVGSAPQDRTYANEPTELVVGDHCKIREYVNISVGTVKGGGRTTIGSHNLIMVYSHIAHDCIIGNNCVFANGVHLAGHVVVQDNVTFGGMSGGHQFCNFGKYAMVAAGAIVVQDVPPFCMAQGDHAGVVGLNVVGLKRAGIREEALQQIKTMFRLFFKSNLTMDEAIQQISRDIPESEHRRMFLDFVKQTKRGICR